MTQHGTADSLDTKVGQINGLRTNKGRCEKCCLI